MKVNPWCIDIWICRKVEEIYLWAYDWTGIYVGSCLFVCEAIGACTEIARGPSFNFTTVLVLMLFGGIVSLVLYLLQGSGNHKIFNMQAMMTETVTFNRVIRMVFLTVAMIDVVSLFFDWNVHNIYRAIVSASIQITFYIYTIKIRDRNKKTFKLPKLATPRMSMAGGRA